MKNKIFSYMMATALVLGFSACSNEEDDIFDHSAAERLNMISGEYSARLTDSKGGWVMEYYPYSDNENLVTGVGYIIMNRFNSDGSVYTMMKNKASHNEMWDDTSAWEVITDMGPVLSYNTWNKCLGRFTDPVDIDLTPGEYSKDESGKGFQGDYEFVMVDVPENGDHIMLKGKKRGLYQRMTRVPEGTDFEAYLDELNSFNNTHFNKTDLWELDMVDHGVSYKIAHMYDGSPRLYPADKDSVAYGWLNPYLITKFDGKYHLRFKEATTKDDVKMEQEYVFNTTDEKFYGVENPENVISCTPAHTFFTDALNDTHRWQMTMALDRSDDIKATLNAMLAEMAGGDIKYELNGNGNKNKTMTFRKVDDELQFSFTVKFRRNNKNATSELTFAYKMEKNDGQITLTYLGARNAAAESFLTTFASVNTFLTSLNGTYTAAGLNNSYSLRELRLTSANDNNHWFDIQYAN